MLEEFFAITRTSVYHIRAMGDNGYPLAVKVALRGNSKFAVDHRLEHSGMISVGSHLISYIPERYGMTSPLVGVERDISRVSTQWWGDQTSAVVALFDNEAAAMQCFNEPDLKPCDPRWIEQTRRVLNAIGDDHPTFFVPHDDLALISS